MKGRLKGVTKDVENLHQTNASDFFENPGQRQPTQRQADRLAGVGRSVYRHPSRKTGASNRCNPNGYGARTGTPAKPLSGAARV
jgi:hypothetical protein